MTRIWTLALVALTAAGADWQRINAGPFEIYTRGNLREAKALLGTLEQLRGQLADLTGLDDPKPLWPVRLVIDKEQSTGKLTLTTGVYSLLLKEAALTREQKRGLLQLMLDANAGPLDRQLEDGFLTVLASLTATGVRVTVGVPPPVVLQTADWVLMQYLITNDAYRGRVRVMLGNLMRGTDKASAVRNAFEKDEETLRAEAAKARESFAPVTYPARTILPERDYRARDIEKDAGRLQLAIAQLGDVGKRAEARQVCSSLSAAEPEAQACVAAAYALDGKPELAALEAEKALALPRMLYLAAVGQPDRLKHQQHLFTLLQLKPVYPEAALAFASKENDPGKALKALQGAAKAAQRDPKYLAELARWAQRAGEFTEESKAWMAAERAALDPAEKEALRLARLAAQDRRYEAEAQARREAEEARLRDIERVKQESLRRVREAEARARGKLEPLPEDTKVEKWWDGEQPDGFVTGELVRVDCLGGGKARLAVKGEDGKLSLYSVENPAKLVLSGAGAETFVMSCGAQKSARQVKLGLKEKRVLSMELLKP